MEEQKRIGLVQAFKNAIMAFISKTDNKVCKKKTIFIHKRITI